MLNGALDLSLFGNALAMLAYTAFALYFGVRLLVGAAPRHQVSLTFGAALIASAAWGGLSLSSDLMGWSPALDQWIIPLSDLLRYSLWFLFVLQLLQPQELDAERKGDLKIFRLLSMAVVGGSLAVVLARGFDLLPASLLARPSAFASLAQAVVGLVLVEQLLRNVSDDTRWSAKPVCLGLGAIFVFDLFVYSQAALFRKFDGDALSVRSLVHSAAGPLLFLASRRHEDWLHKLHVSRAAVFHSASLLLISAYLLLVSGVGYYIRYTGGEWGRALQLALMSVALIALALLVLSGSMRDRLKVYISKNFFNYR